MRIGILLVFGLACLVGFLGDALASVFGMIALLKTDNQIANVLVGLGAIVVTIGVCGTKFVLSGKVPIILCLLWLLCMVLDLMTNVIGLVHFIVNDGALNAPVSLTPDELWKAIEGNPQKSGIAAFLMAIFTGSSIGCAYVFDENGKK